MDKKYSGLDSLIREDPEAADFYASLPDYVQEMISCRSGGVNSFESLKCYADNLLAGDR